VLQHEFRGFVNGGESNPHYHRASGIKQVNRP